MLSDDGESFPLIPDWAECPLLALILVVKLSYMLLYWPRRQKREQPHTHGRTMRRESPCRSCEGKKAGMVYFSMIKNKKTKWRGQEQCRIDRVCSRRKDCKWPQVRSTTSGKPFGNNAFILIYLFCLKLRCFFLADVKEPFFAYTMGLCTVPFGSVEFTWVFIGNLWNLWNLRIHEFEEITEIRINQTCPVSNPSQTHPLYNLFGPMGLCMDLSGAQPFYNLQSSATKTQLTHSPYHIYSMFAYWSPGGSHPPKREALQKRPLASTQSVIVHVHLPWGWLDTNFNGMAFLLMHLALGQTVKTEFLLSTMHLLTFFQHMPIDGRTWMHWHVLLLKVFQMILDLKKVQTRNCVSGHQTVNLTHLQSIETPEEIILSCSHTATQARYTSW